MNTKIRFILAALSALFLVSCAGGPGLAVQTPFGTALIGGAAAGGQGYGPNGPPRQYAGDGHSGPPGARQNRPWGELKTVEQRWKGAGETQGVHITVEGDARTASASSNDNCLAVRRALIIWCNKVHGEHGVWPTISEANDQAKIEFSKLGLNLEPVEDKGPKGFMITQYEFPDMKHIAPQKKGAPIPTVKVVGQSVVPPSILERSRKGKPDGKPVISTEREKTYLGETIPYRGPNT